MMNYRFTTKDRIGAYGRFSTDLQSASSVSDQFSFLGHFAQDAGGRLDDKLLFGDEGVSGAVANRLGLNRLITAVMSELLDILLVEKWDRLSRDDELTARLRKLFHFYGVRVIAVSDGIDTAKDEPLLIQMKGLMAGEYRLALKKQTRRGLVERARLGFVTGKMPFGYGSVAAGDGSERKRPIIVREEAEIVRQIFDRYQTGMSAPAIASALNVEGIPSRHGRGWSGSMIRELLRNEKYVGIWHYNERRWELNPSTEKRVPRPNAAAAVVTHRDEALRIVDNETWEVTRERIRRQAETYPGQTHAGGNRAGSRALHPFTHLLRCGTCGGSIQVSGGSGNRRYYRCATNRTKGVAVCANSRSFREDALRSTVFEGMTTLLFGREALTYARSRLAEADAQLNAARDDFIREHEGKLHRARERAKNTAAAIAAGGPMQALLDQLRDAEQEAKAQERIIAEIEAGDGLPVRLPTDAEIQQHVFDIQAALDDRPEQARAALSRAFAPEGITMVPTEDGGYELRTELLPGVLMLDALTPAGRTQRALNKIGCGGRI